MFIDHATADLRTDAAWPDLYRLGRQDPRDSVRSRRAPIAAQLDRAEAVILPTDESAGEQWT